MPGAQSKSRPEAAFGGSCKPSYLDAASIGAEAASVADGAADIAPPVADAPASAGGAAMVEAGGVVVVVVVSSFLLQAANETAAAKVTISNAVFMFLLDFGSSSITGKCGSPRSESPSIRKTRKSPSISSA
jgi:hypothetical protein